MWQLLHFILQPVLSVGVHTMNKIAMNLVLMERMASWARETQTVVSAELRNYRVQ